MTDIATIGSKDSATTSRQTPWAMIGKPVTELMTAQEAVVAGELDWTVATKSLFVGIGGKQVKVPQRRAVVREDTGGVLGLVSDRYQEFQNRDAFSFADSIVDSGEAKYDTVGSYKSGKVIFLSMKLPQQVLVGGEDAHDLYVLLRTSHDGSKAITVNVTPVRVLCTNTVEAAVRGARHRWSMQHTSKLEGKLKEARDTLKLSFQYGDAFSKWAEQLVSQKVTDDQFHDIISDLLPERPRTQEVVDSMVHLFKESPTNGYHGNGWGALNAVSEYFEHGRSTRSGEAMFYSTVDGQGAKLRDQLSARVLALA